MTRLFILFGTFAGMCTSLGAQEKSELAQRAHDILKVHCYRCHGEKGAVEGGLSYLLDAKHLVQRKKVVPGNPQQSLLFQRVRSGEMPPASEKARPSAEEIGVLEGWIKEGADELRTPEAPRARISHGVIVKAVAKDLNDIAEEDQPFTRYFTLANFYNEGVSQEEIETYRVALSKLLNSLSWNPRISVPTAVDSERTLYRIDLRKYSWTSQTWALMTVFYPYAVSDGSEAEKKCAEATQTKHFVIRADWFASHIGSEHHYTQALQLPISLSELEKKLRVDVPENFKSGEAKRAAFAQTPMSKRSRMIERHESLFGSYWLSYDLDPIPGLAKQAASPATRPSVSNRPNAALFHLPNGLLAYIGVDSSGKRSDTARGIRDPRKPDRPVRAPFGCMSCHTQGVIARDDEVRTLLESSPKSFTKTAADSVRQLYPGNEKWKALVDDDVERYRDALKKAGVPLGSADPVVALAVRHQEPLDVERVAIELGMSKAAFVDKMKKVATPDKLLTPLAEEGGKVKRVFFEAGFSRFSRFGPEAGAIPISRLGPDVHPEMLQPLRGKFLPRPVVALSLILPDFKPAPRMEPIKVTAELDHVVCQFPGEQGSPDALAVAPKERLIAAESQPGVITVFDPVSGEAQRRIQVSTASVRTIDFSADGKKIVTTAQEKFARLADLTSGKTKPLSHPTTVVTARFSPDQRWIATVSDEVQLWHADTGKRANMSFPKAPDAIVGLAFSSDSKTLAVFGKFIRLWDVDTGKERAVLREHKTGVTAVAFSADGKLLTSSGQDRNIVVWDLATLESKMVLRGHKEPITSLAFTLDSTTVVSGAGGTRFAPNSVGEIKMWSVKDGAETVLQGTKRGVSAVSIGSDGKLLAAICLDRSMHVWSLDKSVSLAKAKAVRPFEGHGNTITSMFVSKDAKHVLTGGADATVRLFNIATGEELMSVTGHTRPVYSVVFAPDGKHAYSASDDDTVRIWDLKKGVQAGQLSLPKLANQTAFSEDGKTLAVGFSHGLVQLVDPASGKILRELKGGAQATQRLLFSSNSERLVVVDQKRNLRVWDLNSGNALECKPDQGHEGQIKDMALSPDGRLLATAGTDRTVCLWDLQTGNEIQRIGIFPSFANGVVFAPDSRSLFVMSGTGSGTTKKSKAPPTSKLPPTMTCCIVMVDVATGRPVQYWDDLDDVPHRSIFVAEDRMLTVVGNRLKKWTPEGGKTIVRR